jgi:hypothetical protein
VKDSRNSKQRKVDEDEGEDAAYNCGERLQRLERYICAHSLVGLLSTVDSSRTLLCSNILRHCQNKWGKDKAAFK